MTFGIREARRLYGTDGWGNGYFDINEQGRLIVTPTRGAAGVDLYELVSRLRAKKLRLPMLVRFPQILESRVDELTGAFRRAIKEFKYPASYHGVFPIKVNQHRDVVEALVRAGRRRHLGLEAGSKAELAVALAQDLGQDGLIICNGYKDEAYIRLALRGTALGRRVVMIAEKPMEIPLICEVSKKVGVTPHIGIRIRLRARGSGKWEKSSGSAAKFGLTTQELLDAVEELKRHDLLDAFELLHFHAGSQITEIKRIKTAVKEGARVYAKLRALGCRLTHLDVGGGLGVDYDGSNTSYEASMNYSVVEYANDVVYSVQEICEAENVPCPILVSESGRALTAYHALLLCDVRGRTSDLGNGELIVPADAHDSLLSLHEIYTGMTRKNHREYFHDAEDKREELERLFDLGYLSLRDRALAERLHMRIQMEALRHARADRFVPDEFEALEKRLITKYIANFSVFQSIPDSWALDQLFPVMPVHRLNEEPTVQATLCDVTCDSDGEVDRFVDSRDVSSSLPVHEIVDGEPYIVAITMIGAYQDVLGDYHNLFGRADEAHVRVASNGAVKISHTLKGDEPTDVLRLFDYDPDAMAKGVETEALAAVKAGRIKKSAAQAIIRDYRASLKGSTYLSF
ncbi:MAG: biosynthetic arginine decarboxylase [Planctomycetota bacterium]